jgi:alpha-2-macroglobulin
MDMKALIFLMMTFAMASAADSPAMRKQAAELEKQGNWREAYELRVKILREVDDADSGKDLQIALESQQLLRELEKLDPLLAELTESKKDNPDFMKAAGEAFLSNHGSYGQILDGEFRRGTDGRGDYIQVNEQDRLRALQCFLQAHRTVEKGGAKEVEILRQIGNALTMTRTGSGNVWRLHLLTDVKAVPDYTERIDTITSEGAPVDAEGNPSWIDVPESWETASSDGDRWRWTMKEIARIDPNQAAAEELKWLQFCQAHYDVNTLASYGWWSQPDVKERDGILQASTLKETETIARLANGVKRFTLREDHQFIPGLRKLMRRGKGGYAEQAGDELVQVFLNRRQYVQAAETLKEVIGLHGKGDQGQREKLLEQILGNWSRFGTTPTYHAANPVEVPYTFRNAKEVSLKLSAVKDELVMADIIEYLKGNPVEVDHQKINFGGLGTRLIGKERGRYVGEEIRSWKQELKPDETHRDTETNLDLGKLAPGCYLLESKLEGGNTSWIVVWVRDLVLLKRSEGGNEVFYLVDAADGSPVAGELEFFGYYTDFLHKAQGKRRFNTVTRNFKRNTDADGKLVLDDKQEDGNRFQWHVIARAGEGRAHLSGQYFRWHDSGDRTDYVAQKTIGITDRPVYRPGQKVYVKLWAGEARYDLGEVSTYAGKTADIEIRDGRNELILEKKGLGADAFGGIEFDFDLKEEAALGVYNVLVTGGVPNTYFTFRVEEYKKPEYEVKVDAPAEPVALGESFEATVSANYYHGAPVTEATVKIKVERNFFNDRWFPAGPWDWLYGPGYWWAYPETPWYPGWARWGCIRPAPPWWQQNRMGAPELVLEQTAAIGADGKVKVKIDSSIAKLVHGDQDHRYSITAEVVDASRRTIVGNGSVLAAREPFGVTVWLDRGYANVGDKVTGTFAARTLDGKEVEGKATAILYSSGLNADGEIEEKEIGKWTPEGGSWTFTASKAGQYRVAVVFTDKKGRKQEGATVFSVRGAKAEGNFRYNALELIPDKKEYRPGDTVKLLVNVDKADSRVWLFLRPSQGKLAETKILRIEGKSQTVEIPVTLGDMPNFFIEGVTVADGEVHTVTREIVLPPEKRVLNVEVAPAKGKLKPREKTSFIVRITDSDGKPYQGSAAISVYDKSLEYISGGSNVGEIVPFFWDWKRHHYGQGMQHSQQFSGSHLQLPNSLHMQQLGIFGHMAVARNRGMMMKDGGGGFGGELDAAPMAAMRAAPMMLAEASMDAFAATPEEKAGEAAPEVVVRTEFADLLKWVGSVETDEKGEAVIDLEMPDNLTTWKIKTWAMGKGTRVGEGSAEIVTSKDLIIRLQAPRFFIEKDEVTLSAIVHNYHAEAKDVAVSLDLDGRSLEASGNLERRVAIPSMGETRIDWTVKAVSEGEAVIRMKAIAADESDAMEMKFPVFVHGILKTESYSRAIAPDGESAKITFKLPQERRPAESRVTVQYSPSVASAMVDALPYLASYPYGCTEQTLNRFLPTTVVHHLLKDLGHDIVAIKNKRINLNPQQLGDPMERAAQWKPGHPHWNPVWDEEEVAKMERAGIAKLRDQQNPDGGWGWFSAFGHQSYAHTTAVVMHGLLLARDNGAKVPDDMIARGLAWLAQYEEKEADRIVHWEKRKENTKPKADSTDALVRRILGEGGKDHPPMLGFLFRDKSDLPVYAKSLLGLELHRTKDNAKRDEVIRNIRQFLKTDEENQTAYLDLGNGGYWWVWYGSEFEAQAWFLKLLAAAEPESPDARGLVKYLINNRRHGHYWNSTRDTAYCIEAIGEFLKATNEGDPNLTVEVLFDGKPLKTVEITKENLFSFDNTALIAGDILSSGDHSVELRKKGDGPLYANAYVEYFTLEDHITAAGLEVKVDRTYHKLVPETKVIDAVDSKGQAIDQKRAAYQRVPLKSGDEVKSGDLIEVTLGIDSKNDYEYLVFEDWKAAGMEAVEVQSGYNPNGLGAYMELRDEKVSLFVQSLPRGRHNLSYRLRAEIPGKFSALPTRAEAMYAPELRANSDSMKFTIGE